MLESLKAYWGDVRRMRRLTADVSSLRRYAVDRMLVMFLARIPIPGKDKAREIRLRDEVRLSYRLNRGDMQSIREVWLEESYRLPSDEKRQILVDLGANIGLTSIWLARRYGCEKVIAVEAVPSNSELARKNLASNLVDARVIEAAVGPLDGVAHFQENDSSNLGHINSTGREVCMISMNSLLHGGLKVDLLKIDIEGGEQALLSNRARSWLNQIKEIVIEFHPDHIDYPGLVRVLKNAGFEYFAAGTAFPNSMDYFRRPAVTNEIQIVAVKSK